jgi:hypothetical protein
LIIINLHDAPGDFQFLTGGIVFRSEY